jgi:protein-L-isoaspartate O-methyltransferase
MSSSVDPTSAAAFESMYQARPDPWHFATSTYEINRYQAIMSGLLRPAYAHAFEPGCSIGELTARLARVCRKVSAMDIAPTAVARARLRCAHLPHVDVQCGDAATDMPQGPFDLIVFSEMGYYFSAPALSQLIDRLIGSLVAEGELTATHWLGSSPEHVLHGDAVHAVLASHPRLRWMQGGRHDGFRIDSWQRL